MKKGPCGPSFVSRGVGERHADRLVRLPAQLRWATVT
jgi:hypothetical protein